MLFDFDSGIDDAQYAAGVDLDSQASDVGNLEGAYSGVPLQTDTTPQSSPSVLQLLGSAPQIARDAGTAVGTLQRNLSNLGGTFNSAKTNAATGNSLGTWWQYASTTDKLVVGLAVVGILVALRGEL